MCMCRCLYSRLLWCIRLQQAHASHSPDDVVTSSTSCVVSFAWKHQDLSTVLINLLLSSKDVKVYFVFVGFFSSPNTACGGVTSR